MTAQLLAALLTVVALDSGRRALPHVQDWRTRRRRPRIHTDDLTGTMAIPVWFSPQMWLAATRTGFKHGNVTMRLFPRVDGTYDLHLYAAETNSAEQLLAKPIVTASLELLQAVENSDAALVTDDILEHARKLRRVIQPLVG